MIQRTVSEGGRDLPEPEHQGDAVTVKEFVAVYKAAKGNAGGVRTRLGLTLGQFGIAAGGRPPGRPPVMAARTVPGATARCRRASSSGSSRATAYREDTESMKFKRTAVALAISAAALNPAGQADAHRRPAGRNPQPELVRTLIARHFPTGVRAEAFRVADCESGLDPSALGHNRNGTHDWSIFQLNDGGTIQSLGITVAQAQDPDTNVAAAARLWRRAGWSPWVCSRGRR